MLKVLFGLILCLLSLSFSQNQDKKIIILGFDGADPNLCKKWMDEGKLPNLKKLANEGSFSSLGTSNPAQSPVSWCCFATGTNPGKTNIFDFLSRYEEDYRPKLGFVYDEGHEIRILPDELWKRYAVVGCIGLLPLLLLFFRFLPKTRTRLRVILPVIGILTAIILEIFLYLNVLEVPPAIPSAKTRREGDTFWKITSQKKIKTIILKAPITFPTEPLNSYGKLLSGLGVPDLLQTNGIWSIYSSPLVPTGKTKMANTETGGRLIPFKLDGATTDDKELILYGPRDLVILDRINRLNIKLNSASTGWKESEALSMQKHELEKMVETRTFLPLSRKGNTVTIDGYNLKEKQWSKFFQVQFKMGLITLNGLVRFYNAGVVHRPIMHLNPWTGKKEKVGVKSSFEIYATPIQFNPERLPGPPGMTPFVNISTPSDYAAQIKKEIGAFYDTLGWASCTNALKDEMIEESAFLEDLNNLFERQRGITNNELKKDWNVFFSLFEETDRVSHLMWRLMDPLSPEFKSPMYRKHLAEKTYEEDGIEDSVSDKKIITQYKDSILDFYIKMDRYVGEVYKEYVENKPDTLFMVISDHGFQPFNRSVNINNWLRDNGYLTLKGAPGHKKVHDLFSKNLLKDVVWEETKAYSIGLGKIYINVKKRESQGIVEPADLAKVKQEIIDKLKNLKDTARGNTPVVIEVYDREKIYKGKYVSESADLILGFNRGYRVSWQSTLGGFGDNIIEDNTMKWSGDHCSVDPSFVNGIFYCNKKLDTSEMPHIENLAPTLLEYMGLTVPINMDKKPLKFK